METMLIAKHRMIVMKIYGEIDHHTAGGIRKELEKEIKRTGAVNIALDFGNVTFMDSSGIGMIIGRYKTVKSLGGYIILYDVSESVNRLLRMSGVSDLVIISDTLNSGIRKMNGSIM